MNEMQLIKCHVFSVDGTVKDYNIYPDDYPPNYTMYLYHGELYFREIIQYGNRQNIMIHKEEFDQLVNPVQTPQQVQQFQQPPIVNVSVAQTKSGGISCPRCGSNNVHITSEIANDKSRHRSTGCLWGIGRAILVVCTCGLWLLIGKRKGTSKTKYTYNTVAICQNCAHRWNV